MCKEEVLKRLAEAVVSLKLKEAEAAAKEALEAGVDPVEAVRRGLSEGMRIVGEKFNSMEYFIPEVLLAADAYRAGLNVLKEKFSREALGRFMATIVIGTIYGDIHSIGKDVAIPVFQAAGFNVVDLGVDVSPERFVEAVKEYRAEVVGIGTYMSETFFHTPSVIEALKKAGLRDKVKVICGGPAVDPRTARRLGADDASSDAWEAVEKIKKLLSELRGARFKCL